MTDANVVDSVGGDTTGTDVLADIATDVETDAAADTADAVADTVDGSDTADADDATDVADDVTEVADGLADSDDTGGDTAADGAADTADDATATGDADATGDDADTSSAPSCADQCGSFIEGAACQCDPGCVAKGDCCADWKALCGCTKAEDCDDKDGCTTDSCDTDTGLCSHPPALCDDGNPCTTDACAKGACTHTAVTGGTACDDGDACTEKDACAGEKCIGAAKDCDDAKPCTVDSCGKDGACAHVAGNDGATCDDGNACTDADACKAGACTGTAKNCDDGSACTTDSCDTASGVCLASPVADGVACDDGNACTSKDACATGKCVGVGKDCDDGDPCTVDTCDPKTQACGHTKAKDGAPCNDFDACTSSDVCTAGACAGKAKACDDGKTCTVDACDSKTGACGTSPAKDGLTCDDGNPCTPKSACESGACVGADIACDDGQACTEDACDPKSGKCVFVALVDGAACNDGKPCTIDDKCSKGQCVAAPASCNDGNPCTIDACTPATGVCTHVVAADGTACADGNACTGGQVCTSGVCGGGKPVCAFTTVWKDDFAGDGKGWTFVPDAPEPATAWHIDGTPVTVTPKTGTCTLNFNNGKNFETASGVPAGSATSVMVTLPQADRIELHFSYYSDTETSASFDKKWVEVSDDGFVKSAVLLQLAGSPAKKWNDVTLPIDGFAGKKVQIRFRFDAMDGVQNAGAGFFVDDVSIAAGNAPGSCVGRCGEVAANGQCGCDAACAKAGNCCADIVGVCAGICKTDADCDDGAPCTIDTCTSGTCAWKKAVDGTVCDDGKLCTVGDACVGGACLGGPKKCDDANPCTYDTCDALAGCVYTPGASAPCDDGKPCTTMDACKAGACAGVADACDDGKPCTTDVCDSQTGACTHSATADGALCDDGDVCTVDSRCKAAVCAAGNPKCTDDKPCTLDLCDAKTGACTFDPQPDGASCNDGSVCTVADHCESGTCVGTPSCVFVPMWTDGVPCDDKTFSFEPNAPEPATGWHVDGTPAAVVPPTGTCSLNFNNGKDYVNGTQAVAGIAATAAVLKLPAGKSVRLRFASYHDTETSNDYDRRWVEVSSDGFKTAVVGRQLDNGAKAKTWSTELLDLGPLAGKTVALRFRFDSVDSYANDHLGWFVDDVVVEAGQVTATACKVDADCSDGDPCSADSCKAGLCAYAAAKDGVACGDGDACISGAACKAGVCAGTKKVCDDGKPCTLDNCDPAKGCVYLAATVGSACDDGKLCTTADQCSFDGSCSGKPACDDGKPCTVDACDTATGKCSSTLSPNGLSCEDGKACTGTGTCQQGVCNAKPKDCDDGDVCTADACSEADNGACKHTNAPDGTVCLDGDPCTLAGVCKAGSCAAEDVCTYQKVLDDAFPCGSGVDWTVNPKPASGEVGWAIDSTPASVTPTSAACSLNFNNGKDFNNGQRVQGAATSKAVQLPQTGKAVLRFSSWFDGETADAYDRTWVYVSSDGFVAAVQGFELGHLSGAKTWQKIEISLDGWIGKKIQVRLVFDSIDAVANTGTGWFVDDLGIEVGTGAAAKSCAGRCGLFQTGASCQCNAECSKFGDCCADYAPVCTGCKTDADCNDGNACTTDTCDGASGLCKNTVVPDKTACDDGSVCTSGEGCVGGQCGGGTAKVCDDGNPCTLDACDPVKGCNAIAMPGACDDGNPCTDADACTAGSCGGKIKVCDDGDSCTTDACDGKTGQCAATTKVDGAFCADGSACTTGDTCQKGKCVGSALDCNDGLSCTFDACNAQVGCQHNVVTDGTACNDGDDCTTGSTCQAGACKGKDVCQDKAVFTDTFACGSKGAWAMQPAAVEQTADAAGTVGWGIDGTPASVAPKSPACTLNFNDGNDFDTKFEKAGATSVESKRVTGSATQTAKVAVPAATGADLVFWSYADVETSNSYDHRFVEISDDGFVASVQSVKLTNGAAAKTWREEKVDLSRWLGRTVQVRFRFDSVDAIANTGTGWFVDDVAIRTRSLGACKVDADCGDSDGCATPTCAAGTCKLAAPKADGTGCDDGNACTSADACKAGVCLGKAKVCDDGNACTWDGCNSSNGSCFAQTASDGTPCGNGGICSTGTCGPAPQP